MSEQVYDRRFAEDVGKGTARPTPVGRMLMIWRDGAQVFLLKCPTCGLWADLDEDQLAGRVSVQCPTDCGYHETHAYGDEWENYADTAARKYDADV